MSNSAAEGRKRKFHDEPDADDAEKVNSAKNRAQAILAAKLAKTSANPPLPDESAPPLPPGDAGAPPPPLPDDSFVPPLPPTSADDRFAPALPEEEAPPLPVGMHPSQLQDFMPKYHIPKSSLDDKDMEDLKVYGKNFVKDVNLNENRNRYQITPEETRKSLEKEFGVKLELIGKYFPDRRLADRHPPMFLRVTAPSREKMKQVLTKIKHLLERKLNLIDDGFKRKYFEDKVPIGIDASPSFNLRGKLVGQNGVFVKHIQQSADCRIQIKGRGSQYKEDDGREADEPMFFFLSAKTDDALSRAKDLCKDLIKTVREQYKQWKDRTAMESLQSQYAVSAVDQGAEYYAQQYAQQQQQGDGQGYDYSMYYQQLQQQQQQEQQPVYDYTAEILEMILYYFSRKDHNMLLQLHNRKVSCLLLSPSFIVRWYTTNYSFSDMRYHLPMNDENNAAVLRKLARIIDRRFGLELSTPGTMITNFQDLERRGFLSYLYGGINLDINEKFWASYFYCFLWCNINKGFVKNVYELIQISNFDSRIIGITVCVAIDLSNMHVLAMFQGLIRNDEKPPNYWNRLCLCIDDVTPEYWTDMLDKQFASNYSSDLERRLRLNDLAGFLDRVHGMCYLGLDFTEVFLPVLFYTSIFGLPNNRVKRYMSLKYRAHADCQKKIMDLKRMEDYAQQKRFMPLFRELREYAQYKKNFSLTCLHVATLHSTELFECILNWSSRRGLFWNDLVSLFTVVFSVGHPKTIIALLDYYERKFKSPFFQTGKQAKLLHSRELQEGFKLLLKRPVDVLEPSMRYLFEIMKKKRIGFKFGTSEYNIGIRDLLSHSLNKFEAEKIKIILDLAYEVEYEFEKLYDHIHAAVLSTTSRNPSIHFRALQILDGFSSIDNRLNLA